MIDIWREVAVSDDAGVGISQPKRVDELVHCQTLLERAGVVGLALWVESAFVADAYGVGVKTSRMGTYHILRPHGLYHSRLAYVIMIARTAEAAEAVSRIHIGSGEVTVHPRCRAVYDNKVDGTRHLRCRSLVQKIDEDVIHIGFFFVNGQKPQSGFTLAKISAKFYFG
jgi:hypothetical protein